MDGGEGGERQAGADDAPGEEEAGLAECAVHVDYKNLRKSESKFGFTNVSVECKPGTCKRCRRVFCRLPYAALLFGSADCVTVTGRV